MPAMSVRDEWVESIGLALARTSPTLLTQQECDEMSRAALAAVEPLIRRRALEEAAQVAERQRCDGSPGKPGWVQTMAECLGGCPSCRRREG